MHNNDLKFSNPGIYHIQVIGNFPKNLLENYDVEIENLEEKSGKTTTSMRIEVRDQAELTGIINAIYDSRLVLISVNYENFISKR